MGEGGTGLRRKRWNMGKSKWTGQGPAREGPVEEVS